MKRFRPGVIPTVVVALLLPLLVSLGFWQLGRGAEKTALLATYAERRAADPMASSELLHSADPAFRRVHLYGQFDGAHSLLLDNRQRNGKVGVELLQPFQDRATGQWLLVNRGWLPWPDRRVTPQFATPTDAVNLDAWVYVAPGATFQLHADPASSTWPQTITAVEPPLCTTERVSLGAATGVTVIALTTALSTDEVNCRFSWPSCTVTQ